MIWRKKDRKAAACYHAGHAVALAALGKDSVALDLADTPGMRPATARRLLAGSFNLPPPECEQSTDLEAGILPLLAGLYACGPAAAPKKLAAAIAVYVAGMVGTFAVANSKSEAERVLAEIDARARDLATWRRHAIARIAAALLDRGTLAADEVAALVA
jgi:hypothetical protein